MCPNSQSEWKKSKDGLEGVRPYEDGYERDSVRRLIDAGDKLQEELEFLHVEYRDAYNERLTRDALCLKIALLEQKLRAIRNLMDKEQYMDEAIILKIKVLEVLDF